MVLHLIPKIKTQNTMCFLAIDFQGEKKKSCRQFQGGETADSLVLTHL